MDTKSIKKLYKDAAKLADSLPERYREEAFTVIFTRLLRGENPVPIAATKETHPRPKGDSEDKSTDIDRLLKTPIDYSDIHSFLLTGSWEDRSALILWKINQTLGVGSLIAPDIARIMSKQIGLPEVHRQNIRREMKDSNLFVKTRHGRNVYYSLSLVGKERVKTITSGQQNNG